MATVTVAPSSILSLLLYNNVLLVVTCSANVTLTLTFAMLERQEVCVVCTPYNCESSARNHAPSPAGTRGPLGHCVWWTLWTMQLVWTEVNVQRISADNHCGYYSLMTTIFIKGMSCCHIVIYICCWEIPNGKHQSALTFYDFHQDRRKLYESLCQPNNYDFSITVIALCLDSMNHKRLIACLVWPTSNIFVVVLRLAVCGGSLGASLVCAHAPGLTERQRAMCRQAPAAIAVIGEGLR